MRSAAYYRLKAQKVFRAAHLEPDRRKAERLRMRGCNYSDLADMLTDIEPLSSIEGGKPIA
jgi:hypothetical protein